MVRSCRERCVVSYVDSQGLRHSVEVSAASLYEAAVLACKTFQQHECMPAPMREIRVEVTSQRRPHAHADKAGCLARRCLS